MNSGQTCVRVNLGDTLSIVLGDIFIIVVGTFPLPSQHFLQYWCKIRGNALIPTLAFNWEECCKGAPDGACEPIMNDKI